MIKESVENPSQALAYLADCTLATIEDLVLQKRRQMTFLRRQIDIAQAGVDWMRQMGVDYSGTRVSDVIAQANGDVAGWAMLMIPLNSAPTSDESGPKA